MVHRGLVLPVCLLRSQIISKRAAQIPQALEILQGCERDQEHPASTLDSAFGWWLGSGNRVRAEQRGSCPGPGILWPLELLPPHGPSNSEVWWLPTYREGSFYPAVLVLCRPQDTCTCSHKASNPLSSLLSLPEPGGMAGCVSLSFMPQRC